jgi:histidinol-phosphate/aromatic aminotransferase/cobyric acid decarboxylase-like protein
MRDVFQDDDYDSLYDFFSPIRKAGGAVIDPSGWLDTYAAAAELLPDFIVRSNQLSFYRIDEGSALGSAKEILVKLLSQWEECPLHRNNVTLCHSVSEATLSTLIYLKRQRVKSIIFETPAYGVTINQARHLGFEAVLCPTYSDDGYRANIEHFTQRSPFAIWVTHPRMSLGHDQSHDFISDAVKCLSPDDFLIIDEATEQRFPSHLRHCWQSAKRNRIIRLRGLLKGAGLNGVRLAFILHDEELREGLEGSQEVIGTSLDVFSLQAAVSIASNGQLRDLLLIANQQTTSLRERVDKLAAGTAVSVSRLVNGYIGSARVDLRQMEGSYEDKRGRLLRFCYDRRMPVLLGASMRFALDPRWERVRLNFFCQPVHILRGIANLIDFTRT